MQAWTYTREWLRLHQDEVIDFLNRNPKSIQHNKVAQTLSSGIPGGRLSTEYRHILEALNVEVLAGFLRNFPAPKLQAMHEAVAPGSQLDQSIGTLMDERTKRYVKENTPQGWWHSGNTLALMDAMRKFVRESDSDHDEARMNSGLVGAARAIGMPEEAIREAFASDRMLTIYEP